MMGLQLGLQLGLHFASLFDRYNYRRMQNFDVKKAVFWVISTPDVPKKRDKTGAKIWIYDVISATCACFMSENVIFHSFLG